MRFLLKAYLRPKYHFLMHYFDVFKMSGLPKHFWSLQFEGKQKEAKVYSHIITR